MNWVKVYKKFYNKYLNYYNVKKKEVLYER